VLLDYIKLSKELQSVRIKTPVCHMFGVPRDHLRVESATGGIGAGSGHVTPPPTTTTTTTNTSKRLIDLGLGPYIFLSCISSF
jgi:hypothetical protein